MKHITLFLLALLLSSLTARAIADTTVVLNLIKKAEVAETLESTKVYINQAIVEAEKIKYYDGLLTATKILADISAQGGDIENGIVIYLNVLNKYKLDYTQLSTVYNQIGIYHVYLGHYDSTEFYFLKALEIRKKQNDQKGVGAAYNNLGNVSQSKGDYDKAADYFMKSLKIREEINDTSGRASSLTNLGLLAYKQKKFTKALKYYKKALALNQLQNNVGKEILILFNFGNLYDEIEKFDSALIYHKLAIQKAEQLGDKRLKAMAYGNIGVTYQNMKNGELAKVYILKALAIREISNDLEGMAINYNNLAAIYVDTDQKDSAIFYFSKSLKYSLEIGNQEISRDNYLGLSVTYEKLNKPTEALAMYQKYVEIKDTILNEQTNNTIAELDIKYETEKKEKLLAREQEKTQKQRDLIVLASGVIFILLLLFGLFVQRKKAEKQKMALKSIKNVENERSRIARDLHDNLGAELTLIASKLDIASFKETREAEKEATENIANITRNANSLLRETVWSIKSSEITLQELHDKVKEFATRIFEDKNIELIFSCADNNTILTPNVALNLFRICQELINNSCKHSACSEMDVSFSKNHITVSDNGKGFDPATTKAGYGLGNIESRANEIGVNLSVTSENGTQTKLSF